ncbi:MAG: hypothetical protein IKD72_02185, partial [Clostridia bacterium]|nr:hypothetical protein [Clostridia bacterium]
LDSSYYHTGSGEAVKGVFEDARELLDWAFDSLSVRTVADPGRVAMQVQVIDGKQADTVALVPAEEVRALVPNAASPEEIELVALGAPASLEAPVAQGTPVCEGELRYQGKLLAKTTLVAAQAVQLSVAARISRLTRAWIGEHPLLTALLLIALAAVVLLAARRRGRRKRTAKRRTGK